MKLRKETRVKKKKKREGEKKYQYGEEKKVKNKKMFEHMCGLECLKSVHNHQIFTKTEMLSNASVTIYFFF